jgi:hypothetical protein
MGVQRPHAAHLENPDTDLLASFVVEPKVGQCLAHV